jgi:preprotein translocase subunit SecG
MGEILLEVLIIIASILLILVVLIQDSKGGGLTSTFGASNQILGVRKTTDFLEKATWTLAISVIVLSLATAWIGGSSAPASSASVSLQQAANAPTPQQAPNQQAPQQQQQQQGAGGK